MNIKNIEINEKKIGDLSKRSKLRLKKEKSIKLIKNIVLCGCISISLSTLFSQIYSTVLLLNKYKMDNHNIYSNRKLTISEEEKNNIIKNFEKKYNIKIKPDQEDSMLLFDSIYKNDNLTEKEKSIFYSLVDIIDDNPYLNKEQAYKNLLNLDINYVEDRKEVDGTWDGVNINIDNNISKNEERQVMTHEDIHAIFSVDDRDLPSFMVEGMCELLNVEYNNYKYHTYHIYINMVKMLCETVGSDTVLKAYSIGNMDCIYKEMSKIKGNYDDAKKLITNIDEALHKHHYHEKEFSFSDRINLAKDFKEFRKYYNIKEYDIENRALSLKNFFDLNYLDLENNMSKESDRIQLPKYSKAYFPSKLTKYGGSIESQEVKNYNKIKKRK